jgi:hypothetical protein
MAMLTNIDYELIYQLTYRKNWADLLDLVHKYSNAASSDDLVKKAVKTFEDEFFSELERGNTINNSEALIQKLFLLHKGRIYQLPEARANRILIELIIINKNKGRIKQAHDLAKFYSEHPLCIEIIKQYEESLPKIIPHSQSEQIKVTENKNIADVNHTISLFKSQQEVDFFMAIRDVFIMHIVYPNVALSCLVDFEKIKSSLSQEEKDFFFRGIVDCVVFDQYNNFKPICFFELDSPHHDIPEQKIKDGYKDHILALAGQKLYRVRKALSNQGKAEFIILIREVTQ